MKKKVVLILVDGMRPDALDACGHPFVNELRNKGGFAPDARTVMPSVTLPCHMSLFHSVEPTRHGILTNTYVPQVRPVNGLVDRLAENGVRCAFFYDWEQLRDLSRPASMTEASYLSGRAFGYDQADDWNADRAIECLKADRADFLFLYLGAPDEEGHAFGWMGEKYIACVNRAWERIERVYRALGEDCDLFVTADHGGHERMHGEDRPEDMTIPMFFCAPPFAGGSILHGVSILDLAPTIAARFGVSRDRDWEGKELC